MEPIKIIIAKKSYSKLIWEWRNDNLSRKMSGDSKFIEWEEHSKWFEKFLADEQKYIFIGIMNKEAIGVVRFEIIDTFSYDYNLSINIGPLFRGKGLSKILLKNSIIKLKEINPKWENLIAKVKKYNKPSNFLFSNSGFKLTKNTNSNNYYTLNQNNF